MSGQYQGMQCRILQIIKFATFIPCLGHSLNLVGKEAAAASSEAISFFDMVQALYVFVSSSTARYKKLSDKLQENNTIVSMRKKLSDIRQSCHADTAKALIKGYGDTMDILLDISEDNEEKADCCSTARGLHDQMTRLETEIFAEFWNVWNFNQSNKTLQL